MVIRVVNSWSHLVLRYSRLFGVQFVADESRTMFLKSSVFLDDTERLGAREGVRGESQSERVSERLQRGSVKGGGGVSESEEEKEGRVWGGEAGGGLRLARGWLEAYDADSGGTYYFHAVRGDVQWEKPMEEREGGGWREKGVGVEREEQQEEEEVEEDDEEGGRVQAGGFAGDVKGRGMGEGRGLEEEGGGRGEGKGTGEAKGLVRVSEAGGRGAGGGGVLSRSRVCCIS
jgi:hypothetical protein